MSIKDIIPQKKYIVLGILFGIIGAYSQLFIPQIISKVIESNDFVKILNNPSIIIISILFIFLVFILQGTATYLLGTAGAKSIEKAQNKFLINLLNSSVEELKNFSYGDIGSRITNDISEISKIISIVIPQLIINTIIIFGSIFFMISINLKWTIYIILTFPLIIFLAAPLNKKVEIIYKERQSVVGKINNSIIEKLQNIKIVKIFLAEKNEILFFEKLFRKSSKLMMSVIKYMSMLKVLTSTLVILMMMIVLYVSSTSLHDGAMTIPSLISFSMYLIQLISPLSEVISSLSDIAKAKGALIRINEISNTKKEEKEETINTSLKTDSIVFKDVSFKYQNNLVLNKINLTIQPKEFIAIIGPSGAGKTTLVSLLMKFLTDYKGNISINKQELKKINTHNIRKQIAYVPQISHMFSTSILDNIKYGKNQKIGEKVIINKLKELDTNKIIERLKSKENSNGNDLSEGQKQKINVLRAFLSESDLIILDEITSNLDTESEQKIETFIQKYKHNKTIVMIAHRLQTIKSADRIYILDTAGEISDVGSHEELLKKNNYYKRLFQSKNEEVM